MSCPYSLVELTKCIMHDIEVDQSGRTDTLTVDTALAFSNEIQSVILIPKAVKWECYQLLKNRGVRKDLISVKLFAARVDTATGTLCRRPKVDYH